MKYELSLVDKDMEQCAIDPNGQVIWGSTDSVRKGIRQLTDEMIKEALLANKIEPLAVGVAMVMSTVATAAHVFHCDPGVIDLIEASQALIEDARAVLDRGLMIHSAETTTCGIVMMQLTMRGLCHALGLPYEGLLQAVHDEVDIATCPAMEEWKLKNASSTAG